MAPVRQGHGPCHVLFLCTGNAARSILAEALLNRVGEGRFRAFSAGVRPKGQIDPAALALLRARGFATADLRSKSWDEFAGPGAPRLDLVVVLCDPEAVSACPVWPGAPVQVHWSIPDPAAAASDAERVRILEDGFERLQAAVAGLCALIAPEAAALSVGPSAT